MIDRIKTAARERIESSLFVANLDVKNTDLYWKLDPDRQAQLNELDKFNAEVYSYILSLIEKDNKL